MVIQIYGKEGCKLCKSAKKKVSVLLDRWSVDEDVKLSFMDVETEYGAAEADFFDVFEIPTVLLKKEEDDMDVIARWDEQAPPSSELKQHLDGAA